MFNLPSIRVWIIPLEPNCFKYYSQNNIKQDADDQTDVKLVKYTADVTKPMQDEINTIKDRMLKAEKDLAHFRQFEKFTQDQNLRTSSILDAVQGDIA